MSHRVLSCRSLRTVGNYETFVIMRTVSLALANDNTELGSYIRARLSRVRTENYLTAAVPCCWYCCRTHHSLMTPAAFNERKHH